MGQQFQSLSDEESSASSGFMRRKARAIVGSAVLRIVKVHQWIGSEDIRGDRAFLFVLQKRVALPSDFARCLCRTKSLT